MALKYIDGKKIVYDDCEALPQTGWGSDFKTHYAMVTGGRQDVNNPDPRAGIWLSGDYARKGTKSYKMHLEKRTDYPPCCEWVRSEVMWMDPSKQNESNEWNFASISTLVAPSVNLNATIRYQIIFDHKEAPDNQETPFWIGIQGGQYVIAGRNIGSPVKIGPVTKGVWEDWVLHRNWIQNGFLKVYRNGKLIYEKTGDMRVNSYIARIQHGIYKWAWQNSNNQNEGQGGPADDAPITIYLDEIRFGMKGGTATLADFLIDTAPPVVVEPPPVIVPPIITGSLPIFTTPIADQELKPSENLALKIYAQHTTPDGFIKNFTIEKISGPVGGKVIQENQSGWKPTETFFRFEGLLAGTHEYKVTAIDNIGGMVSDNFKINVKSAVVVPPVDTTNYYVSSVESTETVNGASKKSIVISWKDGTKTELYKKP